MLRTSSYTIYVDLPENDEEILLVHGYTGAYDKVSRKTASYLRSLEVGPPPKPLYGEWASELADSWKEGAQIESPSDATIEILRRRGYLTAKSVDEEAGYLARLVKLSHKRVLQASPQYIFMPTYNCNLRCSYCFQDHMRTNPEFSHLLRGTSTEMVDRIMAALPAIEEVHDIPRGSPVTRRIGFFGGEPLLTRNRTIVEYIMKKAQDMGPVSFWAVSNATELETYSDLLGPSGIAAIQITLDGPPEEHDKRRIYADGSGSFERIAQNVDLCLDRGVAVTVRMNIDRANIGLLPTLADEMVSRGWTTRSGFGTYVAPITSSEKTATLAELKATLFSSWELDQAIDSLRESYPSMKAIGRPDDPMVARARRLLDQRADPIPDMKSSFCGAHSGMYIFDAFGDIYACWERTGDPAVRIGRILEDSSVEMNGAMNKLWRTRTAASNPTCRKCRYAMQCGGGCAVLAEARNGSIHSNHCDGFGERFRHSVAQAYQAHLSGDTVVAAERVCDL